MTPMIPPLHPPQLTPSVHLCQLSPCTYQQPIDTHTQKVRPPQQVNNNSPLHTHCGSATLDWTF